MVERARPLSRCSWCKGTAFAGVTKEKNPKPFGEFPYLLEGNPSCSSGASDVGALLSV